MPQTAVERHTAQSRAATSLAATGLVVSLGGVVCLCERNDSMNARRVPQESMCVPVVTSAHDDDVARQIEPPSAHTHRRAMVQAPHAGATNRKVHGFTELQIQVCQARPSPLHERG